MGSDLWFALVKRYLLHRTAQAGMMAQHLILIPLLILSTASNCNAQSEACSAPAGVQGPCRASFPAWSFSPSKGCFSFTYGGCRGGPNRFSDRTSCESACLSGRSSSNSNSFFSSSSSSPSSSSSCYDDPFEFGECGGGLRRWSFVWQVSHIRAMSSC